MCTNEPGLSDFPCHRSTVLLSGALRRLSFAALTGAGDFDSRSAAAAKSLELWSVMESAPISIGDAAAMPNYLGADPDRPSPHVRGDDAHACMGCPAWMPLDGAALCRPRREPAAHMPAVAADNRPSSRSSCVQVRKIAIRITMPATTAMPTFVSVKKV